MSMRCCLVVPFFIDGGVSFSVHASLTVVGETCLCATVLGAPLFVVVVMRACSCKD